MTIEEIAAILPTLDGATLALIEGTISSRNFYLSEFKRQLENGATFGEIVALLRLEQEALHDAGVNDAEANRLWKRYILKKLEGDNHDN